MRRVWVASLANLQPGEQVAVDPAEAHYLLRVLRLTTGAPVEVIDGHGGRGEAELRVSVDGACSVLLLRIFAAPAPVGRLTVAVSAPKGARLAWMVEKLTELGVAQIQWLVAERSQPHSRAAMLSQPGRLQRLAQAAARQAGVSALPQMLAPIAVDRWLEQAPQESWVCTPAAQASAPSPLAPNAVGVVAVGPEGGWTSRELQAFLHAGMRPLSLGVNVLRVETAALAATVRLIT